MAVVIAKHCKRRQSSRGHEWSTISMAIASHFHKAKLMKELKKEGIY